ncbi:MAG: transglycosylase SLT domain-containing protein, partial [Chloroflexota bacterium]
PSRGVVLDLPPLALAAPMDQTTEPLADGERARRDGDVDSAVNIYRALLNNADQSLAEEARGRLAGLEFARERFTEASAEIQPLLSSPSPALRERAMFLLAEIGRANKDCASAGPRYQSLIAGNALLAPYARLGLIQCLETSGETDTAAQHAQAMLDQDPHRRLRIEVLEKLASLDLKRGNGKRYLQIHDDLFTLGATRTYRGSMLFASAEVARDLGDRSLSVQKLSTLVRDFPEHPRAAAALDRLNSLQETGAITWTQAALVRLNARQPEAAMDGFNVAIAESPDGPEAATARYNRAVMILRQGLESEAAQEMRAVAERHPDSAIAPTALLRAGRIIESNGGLDEARQIYGRLASVYPATNQGRNGRFRLGLLSYLRGDLPGAIATWELLAADTAERDLQALALQWQGKAHREHGNPGAAEARLQRALSVGPDTFGGIRAGALQVGDTRSVHAFQPLVLPPARAVASDVSLDEWLQAKGTNRAELAALVNTEPMYRRALELTRLGLREQATWEFDGLAEQASKHPQAAARQFLLASTQMSLGYTALALRTAEISAREQGVPRTSLPSSFLRLLMPLAFEDALIGGAHRHGADALLFAALVRQESRFEPAARSSANALGLSQVVPGTGRAIATALGRADFTDEDLLKPAVNLDFGAYYLARQLDRFGGLILPALAAYNAGPVAVDRWLNEYGRADMDVFAARIPYSETSYYVQVVFENYGLYQRIYRGE